MFGFIGVAISHTESNTCGQCTKVTWGSWRTGVAAKERGRVARGLPNFIDRSVIVYCNSILLTAILSSFTVPVTLTLMSFVFFRPAMNRLALALLAASNLITFLSSVSTP